MPLIPAFGTALTASDIALMLIDQLNGMGDFMTQEVGSLNWCEAMTIARALASGLQFITLMSNQLSPEGASIYLPRWASVYNALGLSNTEDIEQYIGLKQAQFGTPPTLSNLNTYLQEQLGSIFINLQWAPELQFLATTNPTVQITEEGLPYTAPLCTVFVYVWQPRDNQDNLLMPNSIFQQTVESYRGIMEAWNPSYITFITMNLTNRGFYDGYGNGYNGLNYNNYQDGYNVISGTAGSSTITGTDTAFYLYPYGEVGDFAGPVNEGFYPPLQVVDDLGVLQTYFVASVQNNTQLTLTTPIINNITNRTYRTLGFVLDTDGILDNGGLFNT
jgi:hypothetical protein